ncbi:hypothetical protein [uncultured Thiodictyon sp.]|uniref:VgrG-related protein n=1 Tax=uncultured Thiodictyon sp. TaxID=1846217 RepID=UPI0025F93EF3|nr:hypothetical protein [uncultured Thiodictyon sp.]
MNRKPIFDAVRVLLGRSFEPAEVEALDRACDRAEAAVAPAEPSVPKPVAKPPQGSASGSSAHRLGALSEEFESGGRGPGTVSGGQNDPGGVSYGVYQLASKAGTAAAFVKAEGKPWATEFGAHKPGTPGFSTAWKAIAAREPDRFRDAQHAFIERTHYRRVVAAVADRKGLDLDGRHAAVRDAVWSVAVQHGGAANILIDAIDAMDRDLARGAAGYDRKLIKEIYQARTAYVLAVAKNKNSQGERDQLISITKNRYPKELAKALAMYDGAPASKPASAPGAAAEPSGVVIDGNAVAAAHGVDVKSGSVKIGKLHPKMEAVIIAVADAVQELGLPKAVITSGNDSNHMQGSAHFKNRALDFRGNNIKVAVGQTFRDNVAQRLGPDYDVIFEVFMNAANNHLHVEYDPS